MTLRSRAGAFPSLPSLLLLLAPACQVDHNGGVPVLAVRLQEMFTFVQSPTVAGVPLCLSLLSPAGRECARTSDLAGFWAAPSGYAAVRKELRGRYPKHVWPPPQEVLSATPTSRRKPVPGR